MKSLIIGANGQLGRDLLRACGDKEVIQFGGRAELDVTSVLAVNQAMQELKPDVVFNTAARCDVDACESDVLSAFDVNANGVLNVARACESNRVRLVHISTDYVFSGSKGSPYFEDDPADPINVYGTSKLAGERFALSYCSNALVIRTSGLYGAAGSREKGGNFVETMVRLSGERSELRGVNDQTLSPTYTRDLAEICLSLADSDAVGIQHVVNSGHCTWAEWAREIFQLLGRDVRLEEVSLEEFGPIAPRPRFTALESKNSRKPLPNWRDALRRYLVEKQYLDS